MTVLEKKIIFNSLNTTNVFMNLFSATGSQGKLCLKDCNLKFENWSIQGNVFGPNEPGLNEYHGSIKIQRSDYLLKVHSLVGSEIDAYFDGNVNYNAKIVIDGPPNLSSDDPIVFINFEVIKEIIAI